MTKSKDEQRWTAQRRGDIYCSQACGHGCKHAEYLAARAAALTLAARLGLPRAAAVVWENGGWNARVDIPGLGGMFIEKNHRAKPESPSRFKRHFTLYVSSTPQVIVAGNQPIKVVLDAQERLEALADDLSKIAMVANRLRMAKKGIL